MANPVDYDAELRLHNELLRQASGVQVQDHVLDIGCGAGQTTRTAARIARKGSALGVDISAPAIERARELARAEGLSNVAFECADVQTHGFPPARFDVAISRFGTMFFDDPVAGFTNIRRALRPTGRLVMVVWQAHEHNDWAVAIQQSLAPERPAAISSDGPDPFSLADPAAVEGILHAAGFAAVTFTDVAEPVFYGADLAAGLAWVRGFTCTNQVLNRLEPDAAKLALDRLRDTLAGHLRDDGIWFGSRAWLITAQPAGSSAHVPDGAC
jgi:SAM-dependent methyltransferase